MKPWWLEDARRFVHEQMHRWATEQVQRLTEERKSLPPRTATCSPPDDPLLRSCVVLRIMTEDVTVTHVEFTHAPAAPDRP